MMKPGLRHSNLAILALLFLSACSTRVQVTHYPEHDDHRLVQLQTYCWADDTHSPIEKADPTGGHHSSFDQMVRSVINKELSEKNYREVECASAGFQIDYRMNIHEDVVAIDFDGGEPSEPGTNPYQFKWKIGDRGDTSYEGLSGPEEQIITVRHGTIHVGAFIPDQRFVWHSSAEKPLDDRDSDETRRSNIRHALRKLMENFPEYQGK